MVITSYWQLDNFRIILTKCLISQAILCFLPKAQHAAFRFFSYSGHAEGCGSSMDLITVIEMIYS